MLGQLKQSHPTNHSKENYEMSQSVLNVKSDGKHAIAESRVILLLSRIGWKETSTIHNFFFFFNNFRVWPRWSSSEQKITLNSSKDRASLYLLAGSQESLSCLREAITRWLCSSCCLNSSFNFSTKREHLSFSFFFLLTGYRKAIQLQKKSTSSHPQ